MWGMAAKAPLVPHALLSFDCRSQIGDRCTGLPRIDRYLVRMNASTMADLPEPAAPEAILRPACGSPLVRQWPSSLRTDPQPVKSRPDP
jgi:hypothetical protein